MLPSVRLLEVKQEIQYRRKSQKPQKYALFIHTLVKNYTVENNYKIRTFML